MIKACFPLSRKYSPETAQVNTTLLQQNFSSYLTHGTARVRCQELQRSSIRSGSSHDNGVLHGIRVGKTLDDLSDSGALLTDGDVNTVQLLLLISSVVEALLVDDGINGNGGFAEIFKTLSQIIRSSFTWNFLPSLTITNNEFSLTTTNGDERVHSLDAGLHGLAHGDTRNNARGFHTDTGTAKIPSYIRDLIIV